MIIPDNKKTVSIILSKMKPGGRESRQEVKPEQAIDDKDETLKAIAEEMLKAFEDKSAMDLVSALKAFGIKFKFRMKNKTNNQKLNKG